MADTDSPTLLICITHSFPFGIGDDHMEDELRVLSKRVDRLLIIPRSHFTEQTRQLPENSTVLRIPFKLTRMAKFRALLKLDWSEFFSEIAFTRKSFKRNPSWRMVQLTLGSLLIATDLSEKLHPVITENKRHHHIILYSYWNDLSAVALALLKKHDPLLKVFSRAHAFEIYDERHYMNYIPFQKIKFTWLNHIYFISEFGFNYIRKRIEMLDFSRCSVSKLGCSEMPSPVFKKNPSTVRIISIGYNYAIKRLELIAQSLRRIHSIKVKWFHVGEALHEKEYYVRLLSDLLSDSSTVEYQMTGNLSRQQLKKLMAENTFDLLLNVSPLEGIPVSMMESMSCGIPVIATAVGGVPEIVKANYNGMLLSGNPSPEEVAAAIEEFHFKSEEEQLVFRSNSKITWERDYNASVNYEFFAGQLTNSAASPAIP